MRENHELPIQRNPSPNLPATSQGGHYQRPSPPPFGSTQAQMGYSGHGGLGLAPASTHTNTVVGNTVSALT